MSAPVFTFEAQKPTRAKVRRGGWSWGPVESAKLRVLSLGAGVQSTTLALMAAHGEIGPMPDLALFADTGDETHSTMETLAWLQGGNVLPFEVRVVSRGDRLSDSFARRNIEGAAAGHFVSAPFFTGNGGQAQRQCTRHYKVDVLKAEQRRLAGLKPRELAIGVVETWIGISTDEVVRAGAAFDRWAVNRYPLLEARMSRSDCILWLERHGYRVSFYPFILMDCPGFPWRGRITFDDDISAGASAAVAHFLGSASPSQFTRDATNLTVAYAGPADDYTYRRMILHYANLCVVAGGVDLFFLGSEFRGLETIRGPGWTKAGTTGGDGTVTWDYPFVAGIAALADDVRGIFDSAGLSRDLAGRHNLITYSADWSVWMGYQHPGASGQWPHLDQLYGHASIDLVSLDNYMPLSDWTTADGGLDALFWDAPAPISWPPGPDTMSNLGLTGEPTLYSIPYLKANVEGGEKFNWFYYDSDNLGRGPDPLGSDRQVSCPTGDRLTQMRSPYYPGQDILANKRLRWWWNNAHQPVYDNGDGQGYAPHGPATKWVPQSKSIIFAEYGFPTVDRSTNQPNVFYDPKSSESFTPYWSVWQGKRVSERGIPP